VKGRSQTLPWWLGGGGVKTTENKNPKPAVPTVPHTEKTEKEEGELAILVVLIDVGCGGVLHMVEPISAKTTLI
jgi:hypothetical protein